MDATLQEKKLELIQWLSTLDDISIIEKIVELREREKIDWWTGISEDEKNSIRKGIKDANSGNLSSHSDAKKSYEKWL